MPPSNTTAKALLGASGLVLVAGAALAVVQPGNLGDDDEAADSAADATTTTVVDDTDGTGDTVGPGGDPTTTTVEVTSTTAAPAATTTTAGATPTTTATTTATTPTTAGDVPRGETTTTLPGSGLGNGGASVADGATATTGIESMFGPAAGLAALAYVARAAARRRAA